MIKRFILFLYALLLVSGIIAATESMSQKGSPFEMDVTKEISIKWRGSPLVAGDSLSWITGETVGMHATTFVKGKRQGWETINVWNSDFILPYRREVGLSPNGNKIELTFQAHQEALMDKYPNSLISYKLTLPLSLFVNGSWDALTGRSQNARWSSGRIDSSTPDGVIATGTRWITFHTAKGPITFDFNPHGVPTYYVGGMNTMISQWSITRRGDKLELSFSAPATSYGGDFTSKVTIFEGDKEDYLQHHAVSYYYYFSELPAERLFAFSQHAGKDFTPVSIKDSDDKAGYEWKNTEELQLSQGDLPGALYTTCTSSKPNKFSSSRLRPGLYLITLRTSGITGDIGPFSVSLNGELIYADVTVPKGNMVNLTFVRWIEDGKAEIDFEGDWGLTVAGFQLFMHSEEDFQFRRGNWLLEGGYCPGILFADYYDALPVYGTSKSLYPLAGNVEELSEIPTLPLLETALPDQHAPELAWRFNSPIGTMGPDNWGTFNEFNTAGKIAKRLGQVKDGGVTAVILNGFLSRHTYANHLPRVEENIRETVEIAHEMGMKIIDHQDLTILWNADMGFRFLAAHPGYLQHSITTGLPTWGLCPVNSGFKDDYFFPYITDHIHKTGVDGLMLDETVFHFTNFCSCLHCRESFYTTTGVMLPDDENNPLLHNKESNLWKTWIEWRKHAMALWRIDLSKATHQINPGFSNLEYYSEGGFLTNGASYAQGGDLPLSARSKDFLGTEIMSRDVWDDYRYNFTSRNMYNSLRETYGSPVFGLVYPDGKYNYALFGWAMNNMFGQVTWSLVDFEGSEKMNDYTGWKKNMNKVSSVPYTDVAVLFSRHTRDWSVKNAKNYPKELMGTGQFLSERHIPHTFILDDAVTQQNLSRFRVLLAPGMDCITEEQEISLQQFIADGGTLFLTGDAGCLDAYGNRRKRVAFHDILSDSKRSESAALPYSEALFGKGRIIYAREKYGINEFCQSIRDGGMVYRFLPDPEITQINEQIFEEIIGDGMFRAISIPERVMITVYRDTSEDNPAVMVHLLNATGVKAKNGDRLPLPNPVWERINDEIIFEITIPALSKAVYSSPDDMVEKEIEIEWVGSGTYKVTIPVGTVEKYGILYLYP